MTITLARLEDMSLQHWLKSVILPLKWVEIVTNVPLVYSTARARYEADIVWLPNFLEEGRGWVYYDPAGSGICVQTGLPGAEQQTRVSVYNESGVEIDSSSVIINYADGAITVSGGGLVTPQGAPTTADFTQNYVSLIDGWPGTNPPDPPIVAIDMLGYVKDPRQIGPGRIAKRRVALHIFATSSAERDDLTEFLHDALYNRHIPVIDFRDGEPLNYDGTYNTDFVGDILQMSTNDDALFYFRDLKVEIINGRPDWSDLNRWRSRITFTMESYRDSTSDFNAL